MADDRDSSDDAVPTDERDSAPDDSPPPATLPYASPPGRVNFKTLRRMPSFEANLAAAKLEAAGVPCFVADENISVVHPLAFSQVRLQVAEADFDRAEQILDTPASAPTRAHDVDDHDDDEGQDEAARDEDDGEYIAEEYRCPRCHRKAVDLLPLSQGLRQMRLGCFAVLLLPVLIGLFASIIPGLIPRGDYPPMLVLAWALVLGVLGFILLTAKRAKRCRDCGFEWANLGDA